MRISEIFTSIQGESTHAGRPCTFIRTTGCDQRCVWCDTAYAFEGGTDYSLDTLYDEVARANLPLVEVTGGEPLLQEETPALLTGLCDRGYEVLLETGGSRPIGHLDSRVTRIVDLKPPGSGMSHMIHWDNLRHLHDRDEVKFVVKDRADYEWAVKVAAEHRIAAKILFSPAYGLLPPDQLAEWIVSDRLHARLQLQQHKLIWSPGRRGV